MEKSLTKMWSTTVKKIDKVNNFSQSGRPALYVAGCSDFCENSYWTLPLKIAALRITCQGFFLAVAVWFTHKVALMCFLFLASIINILSQKRKTNFSDILLTRAGICPVV
jgi:hypothetical protein